jgi:hypothetical protein
LLSTLISEASPEGFWIVIAVSSVFAGISFYLCFRNLFRYHVIADTPTSKIRSAAQGYTELEGIADLLPGEPVYAPLTKQKCPWFEYKIEQRTTSYRYGKRQTQWDTIEQLTSQAIFQLKDSTGICIIDPDGATVTPSVSQTWYGNNRDNTNPMHRATASSWLTTGEYRFSESRIQAGDQLYAIGAFRSCDGLSDLSSSREQVRDLLNAWKRDQKQLLERFDQDGDGQISMQEWQNARAQAEQDVYQTRHQESKQPQFHVLEKPQNKQQPFILSTVHQGKIIARYRLYAGLSALGFLALGAIITWALTIRF